MSRACLTRAPFPADGSARAAVSTQRTLTSSHILPRYSQLSYWSAYPTHSAPRKAEPLAVMDTSRRAYGGATPRSPRCDRVTCPFLAAARLHARAFAESLVSSLAKLRHIEREGVTPELFESVIFECFDTLGIRPQRSSSRLGGAHTAVTRSGAHSLRSTLPSLPPRSSSNPVARVAQ